MASYQIQNGATYGDSPFVRDSAGNLYAAYYYTPVAQRLLAVAKSVDGGEHWTEVTVNATGISAPFIAIDSRDVIHISYRDTTSRKIMYRTYTAGTFSGESTVYDGGADGVSLPALAIDSLEQIHLIFGAPHIESINPAPELLKYTCFDGNSWSVPINLHSSRPIGYGYQAYLYNLNILIGANGDIHITFREYDPSYGGYTQVKYIRYDGAWDASITIVSGAVLGNDVTMTSLVANEDGDLWVIYLKSGVNAPGYIKYTAATDTWGTATAISVSYSWSIVSAFVDSSYNINLIGYVWPGGGADIAIIKYNASTDTWGADQLIVQHDATHSYTSSYGKSAYFPITGGAHPTMPITGYCFLYTDNFSGSTSLRYYASDDLTFPTPVTKDYTRGVSNSLPTAANPLSHRFTATEYSNIADEDSIFVDQTAIDQYSIFSFRNKGSSVEETIEAVWIGQSSLAPSSSTIYLQIYNRTSGNWETLDSDNSTAANTPLTLTGEIVANMDDYYDANLWVDCRVYQAST